MNIFIDSFSNSISILTLDKRKKESCYLTKQFEYSLNTLNSKIKALNEIIDETVVKDLKKENNDLILTDGFISYDTASFPNLSRRRVNDIFLTQFRLSFPSYKNYYLNHYELVRDDKNVTIFYEIANRDSLNKLVNVFNIHGIPISKFNTFSSILVSKEKLFSYPIAYLVVGEYNSELIITKGNSVIGINEFGFGSKVLLNDDHYLSSSYSFNNNVSLSFSGFIKANISERKDVNDHNILQTDKDDGLTHSDPKELRLLKDNQLKQYILKNNFRKFYARVLDITEFYNKAPWYFPLKEIQLISSQEVFDYLTESSKEDNQVSFVKSELSISSCASRGINHNPLFNKRIARERRKIDWAKLLTMEIGKKKKDSH